MNQTPNKIVFKDSGIGLSEEDIGKLFVPFPGIHHGLDVSSSGLGLAIPSYSCPGTQQNQLDSKQA